MTLRRSAAVIVFVLALLNPAPAEAGWGYWSASPCRADVEWYATGAGVWYWQYGWSEANGAKLVPAGYFLNAYAGYGYECGFLGAPRSNRVCVGPNYSYQAFEGGQISRNVC